MKALYLLIMVTFVLTRSETIDELHPDELSSPQAEITEASNLFANKMYKVLAEKEGNLLFSPLSVHALLSMMYQGMSGKMKDTFSEVLHLPDISATAEGYSALMGILNNDTNQETLCLNIANKIFIDSLNALNPTYKETVEEKFFSEIQSVDFTRPALAAQIINEWTKNKTLGKIKELFTVEELAGSVIVLANSVYFKSSWLYKFKNNFTAEFYTNQSTVSNVIMMSQTLNVYYEDGYPGLNAEVVDIPYTDRGFNMLFFLPHERDGIEEVESQLAEIEINKLIKYMDKRTVNVTIPKFKFKETVQLKDVLGKMGLGALFKPGGGHLSGIVENGDEVYVSGAIQKVFIQVDKSGTEAAAVTGVRARTRSKVKVMRQVQFNADHPFIFLLTHHEEEENKNGPRTIVFYGKVMNPKF